MNVTEVMSRNPVCCTEDTTLEEVARLMCEHDCGEIPIIEGRGSKRVIGVITDRDITCRAVAKGKDTRAYTAGDCMSAPAVTVKPDTLLEDCCRIMEARQIRRVPVVDERDACIGILSQADVALASQGMAGEVVARVSRRAH